MRVLHILPAVAPRYGGPSTNIWPMVRACNRIEGLRCEVASTNLDGTGATIAPGDIPGDVSCHLFPMTGRGPLMRSPGLSAWVRDHARDFDVFHLHALWSRPVTDAARIARVARVPYVVRPAGMLSPYSWRRGWLQKRLYWWAAERKTVTRAAAIHVTSEAEAAEARSCAPGVPTVEAPNGLEPAAFETPVRSDWLRERCGPAAGSLPIVLFLSRLHPKKGVADVLIPAFSRLKTPAFLAIAGGVDDSTPDYGREIDGAVERAGIRERVARIGPVSPTDRWAAFDGAAVFCLPSENENFGTVVPESLARGCPVVVSEGVSAGRLAVEAGAGRMVPRTVEAVAAALDAELADPAGRPARGGRGRDFVRRRLSWDGIAEHLARLYSEVKNRTVRPSAG